EKIFIGVVRVLINSLESKHLQGVCLHVLPPNNLEEPSMEPSLIMNQIEISIWTDLEMNMIEKRSLEAEIEALEFWQNKELVKSHTLLTHGIQDIRKPQTDRASAFATKFLGNPVVSNLPDESDMDVFLDEEWVMTVSPTFMNNQQTPGFKRVRLLAGLESVV